MKLFWVSRVAPPGGDDRDYDRKGKPIQVVKIAGLVTVFPDQFLYHC